MYGAKSQDMQAYHPHLNFRWTIRSVFLKEWILKEKAITQETLRQSHSIMLIKRNLDSCVHLT